MDDRKLDEGLDRLVKKREHELEPKMRDLQNLNELVEEADAKITWLVDEMTNHNHEAVANSMRDKIAGILARWKNCQPSVNAENCLGLRMVVYPEDTEYGAITLRHLAGGGLMHKVVLIRSNHH
jgi:hypothetical protein